MPGVLTISDFNAANFCALLRNDETAPAVESFEAPFGQVHQVLANPSDPIWAGAYDCLVVWTQPAAVISGFARALQNEVVEEDAVLQEVDHFAELIRMSQDRVRTILLPTWTLPPWHRGNALLEMRPGLGIRSLLGRMNQRLVERLSGSAAVRTGAPGNVYVLDAQRWFTTVGSRGFGLKAWYLGKIPFSNEVFKLAVADVKAALRATSGQVRKLVLLDLDDTLWGGVVGDSGWENLRLGGHDADGEAFKDFQLALKALTRRGILLGIVSKTSEAVAIEAMRRHPEMVLKENDFAGWRINWSDKAQNVSDLVAELNLGLQSVVFIDDNPVERARVREALPEVFVPEWPSDRTQYTKSLLELTCFDTATVTAEDASRAAMYASDRQRKESLRAVGSLDDWLASLDITIAIDRLQEGNLARAAQLLNKTNQMNLTTRRLTEGEYLAWSAAESNLAWTVRVKDKFGDLGLTGLLGLSVEAREEGGAVLRMVDFVLSCRVMGRKVEEAMLAVAVQHARQQGLQAVEARLVATAKNQPCQDFFRRSGFTEGQNKCVFTWDTSKEYPTPAQVKLELQGS